MNKRKILVTGGCGFIGSALVRRLIASQQYEILNIDALTYAATETSVDSVRDNPDYRFLQLDIRDKDAIAEAINGFRPDIVTHLAAESHVDRSIESPGIFVETNLLGTFNMLASSRAYWETLTGKARDEFRFHHISTDEVFGSLGDTGYFSETTAYDPRSPYSASKAGSDHLARSWYHTFGLPVLVTNCSNNYGPFQFPEKLIPLVTIRAMQERSLPVYGDGSNVRDWLLVDDHVAALQTVFEKGEIGETYVIGGDSEKSNLQVVHQICDHLDKVRPRGNGKGHRELIEYVQDRPGHDFRYAIDPAKISGELGWSPAHDFESGMQLTIDWYMANTDWWGPILANKYDGERLGRKASK